MDMIIPSIIVVIAIMILNFRHQRDFIAPTFLMLVSFLLAFVLIALNVTNWEIEINQFFITVVFIAIASFATGSYYIRLKRTNYGMITEKSHYFESKRSFNKYALVMRKYPLVTICLLTFLLFIVFILLLLREVGTAGGLSATLRRIYDSRFASEGGHFLFHQVEKIIIEIGYINFFHLMNVCFFMRKGSKKNRHIILTLLPIALSGICVIISTDRNIILRFFIYALILWILYFQRSPRRRLSRSNRIILGSTIVIAILMMFAFFILGKMKQYTSNLERMIGIYGGSGLYNFNTWVESFKGSNTFGYATFKALLNVFSAFGISIDNPVEELPLVVHGAKNGYVFASNIYSSLQPFYQDFGIVGVIIFVFIMGVFFEYLYQKTHEKSYSLNWIIYASFAYPLIFMSIAEQFYARLHLGLVYEIFYLLLIYYLTYGRHMKHIRKRKVVKKSEIEVVSI